MTLKAKIRFALGLSAAIALAILILHPAEHSPLGWIGGITAANYIGLAFGWAWKLSANSGKAGFGRLVDGLASAFARQAA